MNTTATFWIVAALVMAASVGTLVFPMLKSAAGPARVRRPGMALVLAILIPLAAVGIYLAVGSPQALTAAPGDQLPAGHPGQEAGHVDQGMEALVAGLAAKLKDSPGDAGGWELLARSYVELRQFPAAADAFGKAAAVTRDDPQLLADYADALAMANGRRLAGKPAELIRQALALDPKHEKALLLAGTAAFDAKNYREAMRYWQRLSAVAEPGSDLAREAQANIAEARALSGERAQERASGAPAVSGEAVLARELAGRAAPGDTLFIYARAADGPKMPLAILRRTAASLPARFSLDDSMAMSPAAKLSDFSKVTVVARISRSGAATAQPGDLVGEAKNVSPGARDLKIVINSILP